MILGTLEVQVGICTILCTCICTGGCHAYTHITSIDVDIEGRNWRPNLCGQHFRPPGLVSFRAPQCQGWPDAASWEMDLWVPQSSLVYTTFLLGSPFIGFIKGAPGGIVLELEEGSGVANDDRSSSLRTVFSSCLSRY